MIATGICSVEGGTFYQCEQHETNGMWTCTNGQRMDSNNIYFARTTFTELEGISIRVVGHEHGSGASNVTTSVWTISENKDATAPVIPVTSGADSITIVVVVFTLIGCVVILYCWYTNKRTRLNELMVVPGGISLESTESSNEVELMEVNVDSVIDLSLHNTRNNSIRT
eukprot:121012_1